MTTDMALCLDGFHSDECPGCGMTAADRDDPAIATDAAMNYAQGYAAGATEARRELLAMVEGLTAHPMSPVGNLLVSRAAVLRLIEESRP